MNAPGFLFALLIGLSLGMLGGGGSVLTVPVFVYVLGFAPKQAIAMTLPVVGVASLVGAYGHWRAGRVRVRVALTFAAAALVTAFAGARLAALLDGRVQLALLGLVIVLSAASMLRPPVAERTPGAAAAPPSTPALLVVGGAVGLLTGTLGVGGGFLIVPALVLLARLPMKEAIGTSLLVIALNSASGFAGYLGRVAVDWRTLVPFTLVAVVGIVAGTRMVSHVPAAALRRAFAVFLLAIGVMLLWRNLYIAS